MEANHRFLKDIAGLLPAPHPRELGQHEMTEMDQAALEVGQDLVEGRVVARLKSVDPTLVLGGLATAHGIHCPKPRL